VYQLYFNDSKEKKINNVVFNAEIVKYEDYISNKICDTRIDHSLQKYIFCDYENGCYFGHSDSLNNLESVINSFLIKGETVIHKKPKSNVVKFTNKLDTLTIIYELYPTNGGLYKGLVDE